VAAAFVVGLLIGVVVGAGGLIVVTSMIA